MSPRRRNRNRPEEEEEHPDERWMASYMDMVTVLMCMFIVLYAMSTVDQEKFEQLKASLATGFGQVETATVDTAVGVVVPPEMVDDTETLEPDAVEAAVREIEELTELKERISLGLEERNMANHVRLDIDERGLSIRLISSEMFFEPDRAVLTREAVSVLDTVGPILAPTDHRISVEGHTAQVRQLTDQALDWELSSSRAVNVLRYLSEPGGVNYTRLQAVGLGESQPLTSGTSPAELAKNRRVDIIVLSGESEQVRQLIPDLLQETAAESN